MAPRSSFRSKFGMLCGRLVCGRSKTHHRPADHVARSHPPEVLVDLIEPDDLDGVTNLGLCRKRHNLGQVGVVSPERAVKGVFLMNAWKQRDVDAIANEPRIDVVAADR